MTCERIDLDRIPEDDKRAGDLLRRGHTFGCFQVESLGCAISWRASTPTPRKTP